METVDVQTMLQLMRGLCCCSYVPGESYASNGERLLGCPKSADVGRILILLKWETSMQPAVLRKRSKTSGDAI
eukprot:2538658-Pleurochrysis_carterae.AAC.1